MAQGRINFIMEWIHKRAALSLSLTWRDRALVVEVCTLRSVLVHYVYSLVTHIEAIFQWLHLILLQTWNKCLSEEPLLHRL